MTITSRIGVALSVLAASALLAMPALSADLGGRGSMKDNYEAPRMMAGPCYLRSDVGYSFGNGPKATWGNIYSTGNETIEDSWFTETGLGCGSGARGFRAEVMFGYRGERDLDVNVAAPGDPNAVLHTTLTTYTVMTNVYYDMGTFNRLTPYIGAGLGMAYHIVDDVNFTNSPVLFNRIHGDRDLAFAWSVMAGFGYQVNERTILDIGYRYIDLGKATSERHDNAGGVNPRAVFDDLTAHEIRVGLRWHFGSGGDCCSDSLK
jgi:opacity protein-like surface antigen